MRAQQPHRAHHAETAAAVHTGPLPGDGYPAGCRRVLRRFSGRPCRPYAGGPVQRVSQSADSEGIHQAVRPGWAAAGLLPVFQRAAAGGHAPDRTALGGIRPGPGGGHRGSGRDGVCAPDAGCDPVGAAPAGGGTAGTGLPGGSRRGKLSAVFLVCAAVGAAAGAWDSSAELRQLQRPGRELVPHGGAYGGGKPAAFDRSAGR